MQVHDCWYVALRMGMQLGAPACIAHIHIIITLSFCKEKPSLRKIKSGQLFFLHRLC